MDRIRLVKTSPSTSKMTGTKCSHEDVTGYNVIYGLSQSKSHRIGHEGSSVNLAGIADFHMQHTKVTESDMKDYQSKYDSFGRRPTRNLKCFASFSYQATRKRESSVKFFGVIKSSVAHVNF